MLENAGSIQFHCTAYYTYTMLKQRIRMQQSTTIYFSLKLKATTGNAQSHYFI